MEAEMLKGHLDAIVLAALEAGPAHGYAIIETIKNRSTSTFDLPEGTVYPALHRLEQAGLLSSTWITPPGGRRRRVYSLTKAGSAAIAARYGAAFRGPSTRCWEGAHGRRNRSVCRFAATRARFRSGAGATTCRRSRRPSARRRRGRSGLAVGRRRTSRR